MRGVRMLAAVDDFTWYIEASNRHRDSTGF